MCHGNVVLWTLRCWLQIALPPSGDIVLLIFYTISKFPLNIYNQIVGKLALMVSGPFLLLAVRRQTQDL